MKKSLFILLFSLCAWHAAVAQDMRLLFLNAPESVFPLLTPNNRADCVDYLEAGMRAYAVNRLGGTSVLKELGPGYLYIDTSGSSWTEARLLPCGNDTVICVVKGVRAEAEDSRLLFYDKEWNALPQEMFFAEPDIASFFISPDSARLYAEKCDIYLVRYSLSKERDMVTAEYAMPSYMSETDAAALRPLLHAVSYRWNGKTFVRE